MKRLITALLIVSGLCSPFLLSAQDSWQSLINRLTYYSPEKYKSAIDNLKKKYPDSYHPDKDWEKALSELKTDKETLISGLKGPQSGKTGKETVETTGCRPAGQSFAGGQTGGSYPPDAGR